MSAPAGPFNRNEATPQSIQKLLDENAQLIRALVENMTVRGKSMECIQYQQVLHRNLVYLASLADPSLNIQSVLPPPGSNLTRMASSQSQTSTSVPYSMPSHSVSTYQQRQPQAPPSSVAMTTTGDMTSEGQWSSAQPMKQLPPPPMPQYGKGYGGGWGGQPVPYGMQRSMSSGTGVGGGARVGVPMDVGQEERKRQILRMQQEQLIQAQQARRMHVAGHTPMYPGPPPGMMSMSQGGLPPGYSQSSNLPPHTMPPGPMNM